MKGRIHSVQTLGTVDGPGIRYVVFLQGCRMRCAYCHNPDTWEQKAGEWKEARDIALSALAHQPYFENGGGITLSGGEPLLQASFAAALFSHCKQQGIHTCLDTAGSVWNRDIAALLDVTDYCLLDLKFTNESDYFRYTGGHLKDPLFFLEELQRRNLPTQIRQVIVTGWNDTPGNVQALRHLAASHSCVQGIELLPFHNLCLEKYERMGLPFPLKGHPPTPSAVIRELESCLR